MAEQHGPVRTCIGCRGRAPREQLVRLVLARGDDGALAVVLDHGRSLPGRGAWMHDDAGCRELAAKRRAVRRALRIANDVHVDDGAAFGTVAT